jgi:hypothetical protein
VRDLVPSTLSGKVLVFRVGIKEFDFILEGYFYRELYF